MNEEFLVLYECGISEEERHRLGKIEELIKWCDDSTEAYAKRVCHHPQLISPYTGNILPHFDRERYLCSKHAKEMTQLLARECINAGISWEEIKEARMNRR